MIRESSMELTIGAFLLLPRNSCVCFVFFLYASHVMHVVLDNCDASRSKADVSDRLSSNFCLEPTGPIRIRRMSSWGTCYALLGELDRAWIVHYALNMDMSMLALRLQCKVLVRRVPKGVAHALFSAAGSAWRQWSSSVARPDLELGVWRE